MIVPSTNRRRGCALAGLAVLTITAATLLSGPGVERDDVEYYRRRLGSPWSNISPLACAARPQSTCNGVLISSQGGVGSTAFISALEGYIKTGAADFCINDDDDVDGVKHLPATAFEHNSDYVVGGERCFSKVLVIVGDPIHTVESTYRRFNFKHIDKLRVANGLGFYRRTQMKRSRVSKLENLYNDMAWQGEDLTGITSYVESWKQATQDRENYPEVRMVTARTLFNYAEDHAQWIGVDEHGLRRFERLSFDPSKQHKTKMSQGSNDVKRKVEAVFSTVKDIMREINDTPL